MEFETYDSYKKKVDEINQFSAPLKVLMNEFLSCVHKEMENCLLAMRAEVVEAKQELMNSYRIELWEEAKSWVTEGVINAQIDKTFKAKEKDFIELHLVMDNYNKIKAELAGTCKIIQTNAQALQNTLEGLTAIKLQPINSSLLDLKIDELEWSIRTTNCCKRMGMFTLRDIYYKTKQEFLDCRNFGKRSLKEIEEHFKKEGIEWGS